MELDDDDDMVPNSFVRLLLSVMEEAVKYVVICFRFVRLFEFRLGAKIYTFISVPFTSQMYTFVSVPFTNQIYTLILFPCTSQMYTFISVPFKKQIFTFISVLYTKQA